MAIDKAVDSSVLEAGLTTIANAIREKGGTSDTLAFPDAMAEAIAAIEAGGGSPFGETSACGVYVPASDLTLSSSNTITIEHGLGAKPYSFIFFRVTANTGGSYDVACVSAMSSTVGSLYGLTNTYGGINKIRDNSQSSLLTVTSVDKQAITFYCTQSAKVFAGATYGWVALGE